MAKYEDGSYGSAAGIALIAKVLAGRCAMKYTRVAVGKGNIPDDTLCLKMGFPKDIRHFFQYRVRNPYPVKPRRCLYIRSRVRIQKLPQTNLCLSTTMS